MVDGRDVQAGLDPLGREPLEHGVAVDALRKLDDLDEPRMPVVRVVGERRLDSVHSGLQLAVASRHIATHPFECRKRRRLTIPS